MCIYQGIDSAYDTALFKFYEPYHLLIDLLVRVAVNQQCLTESVISLSAAVAYEGVPLHMPYFAKLWYEIYISENVDRKYVDMLCSTSTFVDYVEEVLQDERSSLNNSHIHQFLCNFFTRVISQAPTLFVVYRRCRCRILPSMNCVLRILYAV